MHIRRSLGYLQAACHDQGINNAMSQLPSLVHRIGKGRLGDLQCALLAPYLALPHQSGPRRKTNSCQLRYYTLDDIPTMHPLTIAKIPTTIYGQEHLTTATPSTSVLWCLHGRDDNQDSLVNVTKSIVEDFYASWTSSHDCGLIAVTFDLPNHGRRQMEALKNQSWQDGNDSHAEDMFE